VPLVRLHIPRALSGRLPRRAARAGLSTLSQPPLPIARLSLPARWEWRANKLVARLGGEAVDGLLYKPKGMHTTTFNQQVDEVQRNNDAAVGYRTRGIVALLARYSVTT
jgi:hypothetical protein